MAAPLTIAITPDIENSGRNSATLLHLESAFSNMMVRAGTSPGKNIASRIKPVALVFIVEQKIPAVQH